MSIVEELVITQLVMWCYFNPETWDVAIKSPPFIYDIRLTVTRGLQGPCLFGCET